MTFSLSEKKLKHVSQQCQEIFKQPKTSVLNLAKLIGLLSSTVQAILSARIQFRHLPEEQILALQKKRVLQWSCDTGEFSQRGTPLVDGKLETLQWEENSATRTPYDHSDRCLNKRLGAYCKGVSIGGNGQRRRSIFT